MILTRRFRVIVPTILKRHNSSRPQWPVAVTKEQPILNKSITLSKLGHVIPKINDPEEVEIANEYIKTLARFDNGIHIDNELSDKLTELFWDSKKRSPVYKEIMTISRIRLLKILFTNKRFNMSYNLLLKDPDYHLKYDKQVRPSIIASILIHLQYYDKLQTYMKHIINDHDLDMLTRSKFTRSIVKNLVHLDRIGLAMKYWHIYLMMTYGKLDFDNNIKYADCLSSLQLILNHYDEDTLLPFLKQFQIYNNLSNHHFSMLISSCIYKLSGNLTNLSLIQKLYEFKQLQNLELIPSDLTSIMKILHLTKNNDTALALYNDNPDLHEDSQFDTLLRIHGSENHWQLMQKQFEDLFGRGELPNIIHYGIVMFALATRGQVQLVMMLWEQLLVRKMIPSVPVMHALILSNIKEGNYRNALAWYQRMSEYGLSYTRQSYTFLFAALRGLKEPRVQLKFFKKLLVEDQTELDDSSIKEILLTCLEMSDVVMGEYVYKTLLKHGYELSDTIDAIMMNIYTNAGLYSDAEKITRSLVSGGKKLSTKLYNQLLLRFLKSGDYETVLRIFAKMRTSVTLDNFSYSYLLSALVKSDSLDQALKLFDDLSSQFNVKQYNYLMHNLYNSKHFTMIPKIYDKMIERELTPTFESYECLIKGLCKLYELELDRCSFRITHKTTYIDRQWVRQRDIPPDAESTIELAVRVANTVLKEKQENKATSNLPFDMFYKLLTLLIKFDLDLCKKILLDYYESCGDKELIENDLKFIYISLKISGKDQNQSEFERLFNRYVDNLYARFAMSPKSELILKKPTPSFIRYGLSRVWPQLVEFYKKQNRFNEILPMVEELTNKGFLFTNANNNKSVIALLRSQETYLDALSVIENKLIKGYIYLRRKRKYYRLLGRDGADRTYSSLFQVPKLDNYLGGLLYIKMVQILDKKILPRTKPERELAITELSAKFPKTMRFFPYRVRVADKFYATYLKFHRRGYKKIKAQNEWEANQLRHERRMERIKNWKAVKLQLHNIERKLKRMRNDTMRNRKGERFGFKTKRSHLPKFAQQMELKEVVEKKISNPFRSKSAMTMDSFDN